MLKVSRLHKSYITSRTVLEDINFEINKGEVVCLLGPNGSGKTTLLKSLSGFLHYSGEVSLDGVVLKKLENNKDIIYVNDSPMYPSCSIRQLFKILDNIHDTFDYEYAIKIANTVNLDLNKKAKRLSFGYNRMVANIIALSMCAPITIFDEPVNGLDPIMRDYLFKFINDLKEEGRTFIISTHLVDEVAKVADRVIMLGQRNLVLNKTLEDINDFAYTLIGPTNKIAQYTIGNEVIAKEEMGMYCKVTLFGKRPEALPDDVAVQNITLQDFFVKFMQGRGNK